MPYKSIIQLRAKINIPKVKTQIFNVDKLIFTKGSGKILELWKKVEIRTAGMSVTVFYTWKRVGYYPFFNRYFVVVHPFNTHLLKQSIGLLSSY